MPQIGCLLWAILLIILGFSMMPKAMIFAMIVGAIAGVLEAIRKNKKRKRKKPNFKLEEWEKHF